MDRSAYLGELKMALDRSSFNSFYSAVTAYQGTDDYDTMVSVVAALFTEKPEHFHLLQKLSMFVRPHHKKQFKQLCQDLTGVSCPEDGKEQAQEHCLFGRGSSCSTTEDSEIQVEGATSPTPGTSKDGRPGRIQSTIFSSRHSQASNLKSHNKEVEHPQSTSAVLSSSKSEAQKKSPSATCPPVHSESQRSQTGGGSCQARAPTNSNIPPISPLYRRFHCAECKSEGDVPFRCKLCGFTCCLPCWKKVLKVAKKCPDCQADTKRKYLEVAYWAHLQ